MLNLLLCKVAAAASVFLALEISSAEADCCSVCLSNDLGGSCGGLESS